MHYLRSLDPALGGVVAHVSDLAKLMTDAGQDVTVITPNPEPRPSTLQGEGVPKVVGVERPKLRNALFTKRQLDHVMSLTEGADIIHLHGAWIPANIQIAARARRAKRRYIISPHGMLDDWCMSYHAARKHVFLSLAGRTFFERAVAIFFCAQGELEQAAHYIDNSAGRVVPAAMDLTPFTNLAGPAQARDEIAGASGDGPLVLFLSRVDHKKGLEVLLDAMSLIAKRRTPVPLVIAGTGEPRYVDKLKAQAAALGIADNVHFVGLVRGSAKVSLFERASLLALPTKQENFGLVLTEALAAGTPVITTKNVDIWPELEACNGGLIVDRTPEAFAAAIESLLDDPERAHNMGQTGHEWVHRDLSREVLSDRFLELYREAVTKPPR